MGTNSTLEDDTAVWTAAKPADPAGTDGSRITTTRVTPGATSLSNSNSFAFKLNSNAINPGSGEARNQAAANRIDCSNKHDWHCPAHLL